MRFLALLPVLDADALGEGTESSPNLRRDRPRERFPADGDTRGVDPPAAFQVEAVLRAAPGQLVAEHRREPLGREDHDVRPGQQELAHALSEGLGLDVDVRPEDHALFGVAVTREGAIDVRPSGLLRTT